MTKSQPNPAAWFQQAASYITAADKLFEIMKLERLPVRDPIYFLYAHGIELALKALLTTKGLAIPTRGAKGHAIDDLFVACRDKGLIDSDPDFEMHNFIALLAGGNRRNSYRYFDAGPQGVMPEATWTHDAVARLMQTIRSCITEWEIIHGPPPSNRRIAFGKPTLVKQPVPINAGP